MKLKSLIDVLPAITHVDIYNGKTLLFTGYNMDVRSYIYSRHDCLKLNSAIDKVCAEYAPRPTIAIYIK